MQHGAGAVQLDHAVQPLLAGHAVSVQPIMQHGGTSEMA